MALRWATRSKESHCVNIERFAFSWKRESEEHGSSYEGWFSFDCYKLIGLKGHPTLMQQHRERNLKAVKSGIVACTVVVGKLFSLAA